MIGIYNIQQDLEEVISKRLDVGVLTTDIHNLPDLNGLIIDWQMRIGKKPPKEFAYQAALISNYTKKKNTPIIIYDRHMCIKEDEYKWLSRFDIHLFEPALNNRKHFVYLPHWMDISEEKLLEHDNENRDIDLGFIGDRHNKSFEKYYIEYMKKFTTYNVIYNDSDLKWENVKCMVAIDSENNYDIGYLNNHTFNALSRGCMVILPKEHKYFGNMFPWVTDNINDINYCIETFSNDIRMGAVLDIYNNIKDNFPEFTIEYTADKMCEVYES